MPIVVSCPACGTKLKAPESKAGKKARCGKCHGKVRIPGTLAAPVPGEDDETVPMADSVEEDYDPLPLPIPPPAPIATAPSPSNSGRPAFGSGGKLPPISSPATPGRPATGSTPKAPAVSPSEKAKKVAKSDPKKPGLPAPVPPTPPVQEVLSLDDDEPASPPAVTPSVTEPTPAPPASGDPFAFTNDLVLTQKSGSKSKQKAPKADEKSTVKSASKRKDDETDEAEQEAPRYVRPTEQKSSKMLLLATVLGLAAVGTAVVAVIVFVNKSKAPEAKAPEKKEEPVPQPPTVEPPKDDKNAKKEPPKKDLSIPPTPVDPKLPSVGPPATMLALPGNLRPLQFRQPADKPELIDRPSDPAIQVEAPFDRVKRFFAPQSRVNQDAVVVWQSNAGVNGKGERFAVDTYSGTTGKRVGRFEYDGDVKEPKCDVSGTDGLFAAVGPDDKVTVWNLTDAAKVLDGFDPYADLPDHKKAGLAAVFFPTNPKHLVTVSTAGAVHLFEIATKKQLGEFVPPKAAPGRVALGKSVAMDEGRVSVAVAVGGAIYQVATTAPLSLAWKLELGGDVGKAFGLAVVGKPGRVAFAFETDADKKKEKAVLFCLPNDKPTYIKWPDRAGEPVGVKWSGTIVAVVATSRGVVWVEAEAKAFTPLALAEVPGGKALHGTTERAHWYLVANPADATKSLLLELSMPPQGLIEYHRAIEAKQPLYTVRLDDKGLWK